MKRLFILPIIIAATGCFSGCTKILDKQNLTAVSPSDVWTNASIARAYLDDIYANLMPGNPGGSANGTDEGVPYRKQTDDWLTGMATFDSNDGFGVYDKIRTINMLLDNIDKATFDQTSRNQIKAQSLFWRAWAYYGLVKNYGGVPLILTAQAPTQDLTALAMPRSKTSECVTQIIKDLDDAITLLPDAWTSGDIGRIDKGAAMAFKGRVLLFFASPLFNPSNDPAKWQKAYDATKAAKEYLEGQGKGLYSDYSKIWDDELNKEAIMVRRFHYPEAVYYQGGLIPLDFSGGNVGQDRPSLELVNAFPMKDGSAWNPATMSYDTLFRNRDDRFYASIYYNGSPNQYAKGMKDHNTYLWMYFLSISNYSGNTGLEGSHNQVTQDPLWSNSSFYRVKAIDKTVDKDNVQNAAVDWPEIRFAEVLMNYGECANELNKSNEALDVLYKIRARAGILAGAGSRYGITAVGQNDIRTAYQNERFIEFCFEGRRWDDLRRWKMFGYLRNLRQRHGLAYLLKPGEKDVQPMDDINKVYKKFIITAIATDKMDIVIKDQYYIYGIPKSRLDRNAKLQQNNNWGGTFDPQL
ncbi:putative outer membrane starch-binding protein [Chitinophaga polysaccharea]|uniref:Putative outer membrane starch-binding protein n=1 Tax=Chitinophaga polysaccharea TaxID=1293035 RepID=A0A561PCA7_9BACT|nr:RagB/SusD family nutrient uptake outer membrane protein [Chitinophaga polysaccharea]TWF35700.1 putative outer membrane starch-binding protein [Chitinophaga polysaccharea]